MPFRSPKMYSFIFGFQRFVWWPKCTPASSSSFIAIAANRFSLALRFQTADFRCCSLPFAELDAFARASHTVLLAFLGARIARQESSTLQRLAQFEVVLDQRPRDAQPHSARLAGDAAAGDGRQDV